MRILDQGVSGVLLIEGTILMRLGNNLNEHEKAPARKLEKTEQGPLERLAP
jgi:hypothetical protein